MLTNEQLKSIAPVSDTNANIYVPLLNIAFDKYDFNTKERICCFLAQILHESGCFHYTKEIASGKAYEGRADLGNIQVGDGVKFKGRGLIQVTGRTNYGLCSQFLFNDSRLLTQPELLEQPKNALNSACWFWTLKLLNSICDQDDTWRHNWRNKDYNKFEWLTIKINGGLTHYNERLQLYEKAKAIIT